MILAKDSTGGDRWERDPTFFCIESKLDEIDRRLYNQELRYARFMARRPQLSRTMSPRQFEDLANLASMAIVHYDPNFDFGAPYYYQSIYQAHQLRTQSSFGGGDETISVR